MLLATPTPLYTRLSLLQDRAATTDTDSASTTLVGQLSGGFKEVVAEDAVVVPLDKLTFKCPKGEEDDWGGGTLNGDRIQSAGGNGCNVTYTGTFAQAWFRGAASSGTFEQEGVFGCHNVDTDETQWKRAYMAMSGTHLVLCEWTGLDPEEEHTVRATTPSVDSSYVGQLYIIDLIYTTSMRILTASESTTSVSRRHSSLSFGPNAITLSPVTYHATLSSTSEGKSYGASSVSHTSLAASTTSSRTSASAALEPSSSTVASPVTTAASTSAADTAATADTSLASATGLSTNQLFLVGGVVGFIAIALVVAYFFANRKKTTMVSAPAVESLSGSLRPSSLAGG
ncbi:hypothetical protein BCR35DRAFT_333807 [Leucosporidium creatinivorum]|uniref:Uncharacterized protein n=1 Tax=Leucosporidium creatinivorum TaxID=106004 RepID=A0A1Y2EPG3_9BASI|nr:hypothetical protein BCR35DRAFT_333807 [Leucosporidium creatinivorum]